MVGLGQSPWMRTKVALWTVIPMTVCPSLFTVAPLPRDRSSRAGRIGRLAHAAIPPRRGLRRKENHGVDERSMRAVFSGSRADTKLGVCHPRSAILYPLAIQGSLCPFCRGVFVSPLRVALHARVSLHDQHTLAMQMDAMQELTIRRGWTVIDARADMGSGATAPPRCQGCCRGTSRVACARA